MKVKKANESATQLWEQVFANLARRENASIMRPDYDPAPDEARFRDALRQAGWSADEIEARLKMHEEMASNAPVTSPGVNPHVEAMFKILADEVEDAMERLKLTSHGRVARGVEPRLRPYAAKTNVIMTDESIITVGSHLFRFCGLIARAFVRTLHINPYFWDAHDWSRAKAKHYLRSSPQVLSYWLSIYLSYAVTGTNVLVPFRPAKKDEIVFEQIARAMELFAISHEYGHHDSNHGREVGDQAHAEEFEADKFALKICYEIERIPFVYTNPYLSSGAGAVVLLLALEMLRTVESVLNGTRAKLDSHPDAQARIDRFNTVAVLKPAEFENLRSFREASSRIMRSVNSELLLALEVIPLKDLAKLTSEYRQFEES